MSERAATWPEAIVAARYVALTTFRRDGTPVATPVWLAPRDGTLVVFTDRASGKVKRLRADARVRVAPCDWRGRVRGPALDATAELTDAAGTLGVLAAIRARYGWQARLLLWFGARRGETVDSLAGIVIRPPGA